MDLTEVSTGIKKRKLKKRVGRGIGSGHGKTASRGHKGQYSSAGAGLPGALFTGGQTPIHRRFPKRGFSNATFSKNFAIVNVGDLSAFDDGAVVDAESLRAKRIVNGSHDGIRVLGNGELTKKITVKADHFSASAKQKIEAKGGTCDVLPQPKPPVRSKMGQGKNSAKKKPQ
ncbi:50S ribosomal protein L15 [Fimbriiglobus ruber]|uniref:Large ribosomal subunit protein uL15 n=1 Tax=Fimbriiglobus ruber TaxID=1908690 RepID=A0A225D468_9BACT|nr:50S ribosomal protein L15 [Fimbriiglobus ruber]OWK36380.1 LSU ribosomal protein L15p (L27Ae) [Fimbriiglobus ruber]